MKFKVGDLVTLSAAGRKTEQNSPVKLGFGIVIRLIANNKWPVSCQWFGGERDEYRFKPYELKFFKEPKEVIV